MDDLLKYRTPDAVALCRTVRTTGDFGRLPVLADALEEAGYADAAVLALFRDPAAAADRPARVRRLLCEFESEETRAAVAVIDRVGRLCGLHRGEDGEDEDYAADPAAYGDWKPVSRDPFVAAYRMAEQFLATGETPAVGNRWGFQDVPDADWADFMAAVRVAAGRPPVADRLPVWHNVPFKCCGRPDIPVEPPIHPTGGEPE